MVEGGSRGNYIQVQITEVRTIMGEERVKTRRGTIEGEENIEEEI